jgi:hypothetical protein
MSSSSTYFRPALKSSRKGRKTTSNVGPVTAAPTTAALSSLTSAVASLALPLRASVEKHGQTLISSYSLIKKQEETTARFNDPNFIPRSARINLHLNGSSRVSGTAGFKELASRLDAARSDFQQIFRSVCLGVAELEMTILQKDLAEFLIRSTVDLGIFFIRFESGLEFTTNMLHLFVRAFLDHPTVDQFTKCLSSDEKQQLLELLIGPITLIPESTTTAITAAPSPTATASVTTTVPIPGITDWTNHLLSREYYHCFYCCSFSHGYCYCPCNCCRCCLCSYYYPR